MAKMLDALERAQRERQKRSPSGPAPDEGSASGSQPDAPGPMDRSSDVPEVESSPPWRAVGAAPAVHPTISDTVVGAHDNFAPITEQVRQIRANLDSVLTGQGSRPIVITSPVPGDGKTMLAANLAWVLTDNPDHQVLLVDADMRKPDQNQIFGVRRTPGLSEVLRGLCPVNDAIVRTSMSNLYVMPAGRSPERPTSLLTQKKFDEVLETLKGQFSWIVFDTPPLLPVTDASLIARHCLGLILVVRMGQTHRRVIERAQDLLAELRLPVLGCVLNEFSAQVASDTSYQKYYKSSYGEEDRK